MDTAKANLKFASFSLAPFNQKQKLNMNTNPIPESKLSRTQQKRLDRVNAENAAFMARTPAEKYQAERRKAAINNLLNPEVKLTSAQRREFSRCGVDVGARTRQAPMEPTRKLVSKLVGVSITRLDKWHSRIVRKEAGLDHALAKLGAQESQSEAETSIEASPTLLGKVAGYLKKWQCKGAEVLKPSTRTKRFAAASQMLKDKKHQLGTLRKIVFQVITERKLAIRDFQDAKEMNSVNLAK